MKANKITTFFFALLASVSLFSCSGGDSKKLKEVTKLAKEFTKEEVYNYSVYFGVRFNSEEASAEKFAEFFTKEYNQYKAMKPKVSKKAMRNGLYTKYNLTKIPGSIDKEGTKNKLDNLQNKLKELYKK